MSSATAHWPLFFGSIAGGLIKKEKALCASLGSFSAPGLKAT
jgi:hypothetical protein